MVEARRVVGVEEDRRVADQRPALAHVLRRGVGQVRVVAEVLGAQLRARQELVERHQLGEEIAERLLAIRPRVQVEEPAVPDDADRGLAVAVRNHPDPVAASDVVIRAEPPRGDVAARELDRPARREIVDVSEVPEAPPEGGGRMLLVLRDQAELPAEQRAAAGGVDHPAAADREGVAPLVDRHPMVELTELDLAHPRRADELGAGGDRLVEQVLVEHVAAQLERRHGAAHESAGLGRLPVVLHVGVREPVAQALLRQLVELEVLPLREPPGEEHRRHLGRRLADLGVELLRLLDHENRDLRMVALEQHRCRGAAEGPPEDDDVVALPQRPIHRPASPVATAASRRRAAEPRAPDRRAAAGRACRDRRAAAPAARRCCAESCARRACRDSARRRSRTSPPRWRRRRPRAGPCAAPPVRPRRERRRRPPPGGRAGGSRPRAAARSCP